MRFQRLLQLALIYAALCCLVVLFAAPLVWMLSTAVKPIEETLATPPRWLPSRYELDNFYKAVTYNADKLGFIPFLVYGRNSLLIAVLTVGGAVASNTLVAYAFARMRWKGRDFFFALTLATMMVPFPVLMVPTFSLFKWMGWVGTFRPLWIPAWFGSAFSIFLLRQFFLTIPKDLSEAATIDGAGEFRTFFEVVLPLAKPAISVVALFTFMGSWNDFMGPLIYLTDQKTFTLPLGLQAYQSQHGGTPWNLLMAASAIVIAPVVLLFFLCQRLFIQGIATSGMKG